MLIQAAQSGLGIALLSRILIEEELSRGVLVAPLAYRVAGPGAYYLVIPKAKQDVARVRLFRRWLLDEVARLPSDDVVPAAATVQSVASAVQRVAQPVAQEIDGEDGREDQNPRRQRHPGRGADPRRRGVEHVAPGRDRRLHAEAQE